MTIERLQAALRKAEEGKKVVFGLWQEGNRVINKLQQRAERAEAEVARHRDALSKFVDALHSANEGRKSFHEALRQVAIWDYAGCPQPHCGLCYGQWKHGKQERHEKGCLARKRV